MNELELKFQVPDERLDEVQDALRRDSVHATRLRARYFDTPEGTLAAAGLVLRIRQEGDTWVQTAKGPGRGGFERLEHNVPLGPGGSELPPEIVRHRDHPVHALLAQALQASASDLQPTFETDVRREARTMRAGGAAVEIALDRGEVRAGAKTQRVQELEFELKEGAPAALIELARSWCRTHGLWLDPQSKSALGRRLSEGDPPPVTAQTLEVKARQLLPAIFDDALRQVLANARELAAGNGGDAHVHQLRIGLRRLRTALRELPLDGLAALEPQVEPALRALFRRLGEHRDAATVLPASMNELAQAGHPLAPWQPPLPDLSLAVREADVQDALVTLAGWTHALHDTEALSGKALRAHAGRHLQALHAKVARSGKRFESLSPDDRHHVRKRLKRLRYLAELVRPLYRSAAVDHYVAALKDLQDALGAYQDAVAGQALFEQRGAQDAQAWFGAGWLSARRDQLAHDCAKACRRMVRKADPFWA